MKMLKEIYLSIVLAICLLFLTNPITRAQNLFISRLDEARNAMMPFYHGSAVYKSSSTSKPIKHPLSGPGSFKLSFTPIAYEGKVVFRRRSTPSNTFLEALDEVEKGVYEAGATERKYKYSSRRLLKLRNSIKLASEKGSYRFARKALGHAMYMTTSKATGKRSTSSAAKNFMNLLWKDLGSVVFDKFMAVHGDTTLIFAIDDTGSMSEEIQAAKAIATSIVNKPRGDRVDYILSPFNDPGTGPLVYKSNSLGKEFVQAIAKLRANGGGDFPELTFKGMLDAVSKAEREPRWGSNMYVFTDATAKDATEDNIATLLDYASASGLTINFFTTFGSSYKPFETIARETCGLLIKLPRSSELSKLKSVTASSLGGEICMEDGSGSGGRRKRGATTEHSIQVDESIEKLLIAVTTRNSNPKIVLRNPKGGIVTYKKISLFQGAIYELSSPMAGRWKVLVALSAGKHEVVVKGTSQTNIDFEHFFVMIPSRGRSKAPVPVNHPLFGKKSHLILTIAGANKIRRNSLSLELVSSKTGRRLSTAAVNPRGSTGAHFISSFVPSRSPFRLVLKGKTIGGSHFRRMARNVIKAKTALIRVTYARNDFTIPRGGRSFIIFVIHNTGSTEVFDVTIKDHLGFRLRKGRRTFSVSQGSKRVFSVWFKAPLSADRGKTDSVAVSIKGRKSRVKTGQIVNLIVV